MCTSLSWVFNHLHNISEYDVFKLAAYLVYDCVIFTAMWSHLTKKVVAKTTGAITGEDCLS